MAEKKNIPKLRFREFYGNWNDEPMGNSYSFKVTNSFSRDNLSDSDSDGEVKNIHYGDIHKKFPTLLDITREAIPFIKPDVSIERISKENYCIEGDMIFADASEDINDVGKAIEIINTNKEKLLSGLHTILARPDLQKLTIGFGGYLFKSEFVRTQIQKESQGTKVLSISATRLSKISLKFPSDEKEQTKIASFFSAIDEKILALKKKKELLEEYKKGVAQKLFSQEIRFKDENGKNYPDWEEKYLGGLFERVITKNKENNLNVLTISAQKGLLNQKEYFNKSVSAKDLTGYYLIEENDFAYNKSYSKGYPLGATKRLKKYPKGVVSTLYICFRMNTNNNISFYEQYFDSGFLDEGLSKIAQEGARNHGLLNVSVVEFFRDIVLPKPHISEQTKIANFLSAIDEKIAFADKKLKDSEKWKKGLLQKMFC